MKNLIRRLRTRSKRAAPLCFCALLLAASPAFAQDPVVTAADPNQAEQETYDLVVKISGSNFEVDPEVHFYKTGTTDPAGVTVKSAKRKNPKTIEAVIDVAPDADVDLFDIAVTCRGRTGKGTELFRVLAKTTGPDTTPPGEVLELEVIETDLGGARLSWRAPADDGFDSTSGPPAGYEVRLRTDGAFSPENWDQDIAGLRHGLSPVSLDPWPNCGETATEYAIGLVPQRTYWVGVRAYDEADNLSGIAQIDFTTPDAPPTTWVAEEILRDCPEGAASWLYPLDLEIDLAGRPAILYSERCDPYGFEMWLNLARSTENGWTTERLPLSSRDPRMDDLAFDPATGEPTLAHGVGPGKLYFYRKSGGAWSGDLVERNQAGVLSLAYSQGSPAIAYKRGATIRLAEKSGNRWNTTEFDLPNSQSSAFGTLQLVFDDAGTAAVAYGLDRDGDTSAEAVGLAIRQADGWQVEPVDEVEAGGSVHTVSLAWNPARGDFSLAYGATLPVPSDARIRTCDRDALGSWLCETLPVPAEQFPILDRTGLVIDDMGGSHLFYSVYTSVLMAVTRAEGAPGWSEPEFVVPGTGYYTACWDPGRREPIVGTLTSADPDLPGSLDFLRRQP